MNYFRSNAFEVRIVILKDGLKDKFHPLVFGEKRNVHKPPKMHICQYSCHRQVTLHNCARNVLRFIPFKCSCGSKILRRKGIEAIELQTKP